MVMGTRLRSNPAARPAVVFWLESSHTPSHFERSVGIIQGLVEKGIHVAVVAGDTTYDAAVANGGTLKDFGLPDSVEVIRLPTRRPGNCKGIEPPDHPEYAVWQYMNDPVVQSERRRVITKALQGMTERGYKISHVLTEMWPTGFGMFSKEIMHLQREAKRLCPNARLCPIVRDIPVFADGSELNDRREQVRMMQTYCDRLLVRGDKGVLEEYYKDYGISRLKNRITHVGHFISPGVPPRNENVDDKERVVLVSAGGNFSAAPKHKNEYYQYFMQIMKSKPMTVLNDKPWLVCVPQQCPRAMFEEFCRTAQKIGGIKVRRNMPVEQHRQAIADCAMNITVTGYSGMLAGLAAGVPTVVVPAMYQHPDFHLDIVERSRRYADEGLVTQITPAELHQLDVVAQRINESAMHPLPDKKRLPDMQGPQNVVDIIEQDIRTGVGAGAGQRARRA